MATSKTKGKRYQLTWEAKPRRWRKVYRGRTYTFAALDHESKAQSYARCLQLWQDKRREVDALDDAANKPNAKQYKTAIELRQAIILWIDKEGAGLDDVALPVGGDDHQTPKAIRQHLHDQLGSVRKL